jgi:hypothetical protein
MCTSLASDTLQDQALGVVDHLGKGARVLGPITVETCEGLAVLGRNKQAVEHVKKVIVASRWRSASLVGSVSLWDGRCRMAVRILGYDGNGTYLALVLNANARRVC